MNEVVIIHYDEIGLKGRNRDVFELALIDNIKAKGKINVKKLYGRLCIEFDELTDEQKIKWIDWLSTTFGIAHYSFGIKTSTDIEEIEKETLTLLKKKDFQTFRITANRADKAYPLSSTQINEKIGAAVVEKLGKQVKLKEADLECFIEIVDKQAFIYTEKISGPGGLPTGVGGKVIVLLSGGIDSPVAAWYAMKRGLEPVYLHFHSAPYTSEASVDKVKELTQILDKYYQSELYLCPFGKLQKQLLYTVPDKYRIIMYRRFMFRIAEKLAIKLNAKALVTGEAVGQVASQTIENMSVVEEVTKMPVLRPLCGFDKKEIIEKAKEIGTFATSILPHEDCCTLFMPKSPETKGKLADILEIEEKLDIDDLVKKSYTNNSLDLI